MITLSQVTGFKSYLRGSKDRAFKEDFIDTIDGCFYVNPQGPDIIALPTVTKQYFQDIDRYPTIPYDILPCINNGPITVDKNNNQRQP